MADDGPQQEVAAPRCQHIALRCQDLARSHDFYAGALGLEMATYDETEGILAL